MKRLTNLLRNIAVMACVVALAPLAPVGLGLRTSAEVEHEQVPAESTGFPHGATLSMAEHGIDLQQRRNRRGLNSLPANLIAFENGHRRPANHGPSSASEHDCFLLPMRC